MLLRTAGLTAGLAAGLLGNGAGAGTLVSPHTRSSHDALTAHAAEIPDAPPAVSARAVAALDAATGTLVYGRRAFDELPPASLTKMATALVALERAGVDHPVRPTRDYDVIPTIIGIGAGDVLRLEDALFGLLLNSGNDAALAIAESVADGSVARFVGWMNDLAHGLGLEQTHFANPHGLDVPDHFSSAYDMAQIGRALMRAPVLARIVGAQRHVVEGPPRWAFRNTNPLLGILSGADGIKTGFEDRAGRCLASTAMRDGRRVVSVVLNSADIARDSGIVLDAAFEREELGGRRMDDALAGSGAGRVRMSWLRADLDGAPDAPRSTYRAAQLLKAPPNGG